MFLLFPALLFAGTKTWNGTVSTDWTDAANWAGGVPASGDDVIINNVTNLPDLSTGTYTVKSLKIQPGTTFTFSGSSLKVKGGIISVYGTFNHIAGTVLTDNDFFVYSGGIYNQSAGLLHLDDVVSNNPTKGLKISSGGVVNQLGGTMEIKDYATSPGTFNQNNASALLRIFHDWKPGAGSIFNSTLGTVEFYGNAGSPNFATGTRQFNNIVVDAGVNPQFNNIAASTIPLSGNFTSSYTSLNNSTKATFTFNGTGTQTVTSASTGTNTTFGNLVINKPSGSVVLASNVYVAGNTTITSGTYDLSTYFSNRKAAGGALLVNNGGTLRLAATTGGQTGSNFPLNFTTVTLNATSTVEYYGGNQTVYSIGYGHLILSGTTGAVVKTLPAATLAVAGNFTSNTGTATSVSYTAAAAITIGGNASIETGTTFNAATFSHSIAGNLSNGGTITGATSTLTLSGLNKIISGNGTFNLNNLTLTGEGITATAPAIGVAGNLATSGTGTFTHTGGTVTMTGTTKTISGTDITLDNFTSAGTQTSTSNLIVTGNLVVNSGSSFTMASGSATMSGAAKTISNSGTLSLFNLSVPGSVSTASSFTITSVLNITDGSFSATAGTITFTGTSILYGTANLFNVTQNGTSLQLATDAVLGIAGLHTVTSGSLLTATTTPNTVHFNGSSTQSIASRTFHHLIFSGGDKTATGALTVNGSLTINAATIFNAASYTHIIKEDFTNNGTFNAGTSTIQFTGTNNSNITGATTFNLATINKSSTLLSVTLQNDISVATLAMTAGSMNTQTNTLTITTTRSGTGIILGNIKRTHAFTTGVAYEFEGANNSVTFTAVSGVTSVLVKVTSAYVNDFTNGGAINRLYDISVPSGTYTANLRLHYEDAELNGNVEASMNTYRYTTIWGTPAKTTSNTTTNYIEVTGLTNIALKWTCSDAIENIAIWKGSVSSNWATAGNWIVGSGSPALPPAANDIAEIGYATYTNAPVISTAVAVKSLSFGSVQASTLSLTTGGSLSVASNLSGSWSADQTHVINTNGQNVTVNSSLILSEGTTGRAINLNIGTGTVTVVGSLVQTGGAAIAFSGAGNLVVGTDFNHVNGNFTGGTGTVTYNGTVSQSVAAVTYNNLTINKSAGSATISTATSISGNLTVTAGQLTLNGAPTIGGNVSIASGAVVNNNSVNTSVGGNWSNSGTFNYSNGTVTFNGSGAQTIASSSFNNVTVNKASGTATLSANITIYGNLSVTAGTLDLVTFTANRSTSGGTLSLSSGATLQLAGANNFPTNFATNTLNSSSTVHYNGTVAQTIATKTYGNLTFSNGGATAKTPAASTQANGNLTINSGATLAGSTYTLTVLGNWTNNGTYTQATSTINLNGTAKSVAGTTTFNNLTVNGSYTVSGSGVTIAGLLSVSPAASLDAGSGTFTVSGNFTNNGLFVSAGTVTYTGAVIQTIQYLNGSQTTFGTLNFNGTKSPVLSSTTAPTIATLNVNNTAGVTTNINYTITTACNIALGATFNGGMATHTFNGSFTNNGTLTSSGVLQFIPSSSQTYQLKGTTFTSTGAIIFGGTGAITVNGVPTTLTDVTIDNSVGVTPAANWTLAGDFTINSGKIFNAGTYSYTVAGNFQSDGTLRPGTSTFTLSGAGTTVSGSDSSSFYDLVISGAIAASSDFRVSRNFTNNGTYTGDGGLLIMSGSLGGIVSASTTSQVLSQLSVQKNSGVAATLAKNLTGVTYLEVVSGILDASTFTMTQDAVNGGSISVADNATLKIGGTNTLPTFTSYTLDSLSTVEYAGGIQAIAANAPYGNLTISAAGAKTASAALNIRSNFTLTNGTFVPGSFVDTLGGNWLMTSGSFTNTGSTILFNGADSQYVSSTGAFNNIKINKTSGGVVLSTNNTVNSTLSFQAGLLYTGSNTLILPAGASISGSTQSTGWVVGKLQKNVATGTNVSRTYELGSVANYTPVTLLAASVSTAGNVTGYIVSTEHPNFSTLDLDVNGSVNKYWSFVNSGTVFTNCSVTVSWAASELDAGVNTSNLLAGSYASSAWSLPTVTTPLATSIQVNGLTTLGSLAVAAAKAPTWTGSISTSWTTAGNWSNSEVPGINSNATIPAGMPRYPVISSAATGTINNLTIQSGGSVTLLGTMQLYGTLNAANASVYADSGTIEFKGTAAQVLNGSSLNKELYNLVINNNAGVSLSSAVSITNILSVKNGVLTTNNFLTLKSNILTTARVGAVTSTAPNPITGDVTVERYIAGRRKYRLITSPVTSSTSSVLTAGEASRSIWGNWQNAGVATAGVGTIITGGTAADGFDQATVNASLYTYNDTTKKYVAFTSANGKNTKQTPLKAGVGYYMFVYGDRINSITSSTPNPTTLKQTGTVLTGTQVYNTSSTIPLSATVGNYSLIGNPYACTIDWRSVVKTNVSKTIWGWDANLSSTGGYVTVTATTLGALISPLSNVVAVSRYVQPGQAFYVQTIAANPQLTISESDKIDDKISINSTVFRETGVNEQPLMAVNLLYNNGATTTLYDGALIAFDDSFDNAVNFDDGLKIAGAAEGVAIAVDTNMLSINTRKFPVDNDTLALNISKLTKSQYTLQIFAKQMESSDAKPWLYDAYLNTLQPLSLADTNYINFTIKPTDAASKNADRFKVVFKTLNTLPITFTSISATRKNKDVEVSWQVAGEANIARYELLRSKDGVRFNTISTKLPAANNNSAQQYALLDQNTFEGNNYYQVRSVYADGKQLLSKVVMIKTNAITPSVKIYPNPILDGQVSFQLSDISNGLYQAILYSGIGQKITEKNVNYEGGVSSYKLSIEHRLPKGTYYLHIKNDQQDYHQTVLIP